MNNSFRVISLVLASVVGLAGACTAPAPTTSKAPAPSSGEKVPLVPTAPPQKIAIGYPNIGANQTATWLAQEAGLYRKHGLEAEITFIEGSPTTVQALAADNIQIAVVGTTAAINAGLRGLDVVLIATAQPGLLYTIFSKGFTRVEDLKGKRLAVGRINTDPDFAAKLALDNLKLKYNEDVLIVPVAAGGEPARLAAVESGDADAVILTPGTGPWPGEADSTPWWIWWSARSPMRRPRW